MPLAGNAAQSDPERRGPFNSFLRQRELRETPLWMPSSRNSCPRPPNGQAGRPTGRARPRSRPPCARCCAGPATIRTAKACSIRRSACQGLSRNVRRLRHVPGRRARPHLRGGRRLRRHRHRQGHPVPLALRAPHGADHRQGACRLSAGRQGGRPVQDRARRRHLRPSPADAGGDDRADRRRHPGRAQSARRRRDDRGRAHVHGDARHPQAGLDDADLDLHRRLQGHARRSRSVS